MHPLIEIKKATQLPVITFLLTLFAFNPLAQAVVPPPDGGYPGGNTAEGQDALFSLTTGGFNTAVGFFSLRANTITSFNTAIGAGTLLANTAEENTATGAGALLSNTRGHQNTANGAFALFSNTMGVVNTANGAFALYSNTDGNNNTANGAFALYSNTTGSENTANGTGALQLNSTGLQNTAIGFGALGFNTTGAGNTAIGYQALLENQTGSYNIVLGGGHNVTAGDFNIYIGNDGVDFESNTIRIGNPLHSRAFIAGINGATASGGTAVHVNSDGQLGTVTSSARFKDDIEPMDRASEALFGLKTSELPLQKADRRQRDTAVWIGGGRCSEGES